MQHVSFFGSSLDVSNFAEGRILDMTAGIHATPQIVVVDGITESTDKVVAFKGRYNNLPCVGYYQISDSALKLEVSA